MEKIKQTSVVTILMAMAMVMGSGTVQAVDLQDGEMEMSGKIIKLRVQLRAVEQDLLRRLECQRQFKIASQTGCVEVPGLREKIAAKIEAEKAGVAAAVPAVGSSRGVGTVGEPGWVDRGPEYDSGYDHVQPADQNTYNGSG